MDTAVTYNETRESEARLRAIFDSSLDAIVAMDDAGRILDFNPAAERTFGYSRDAVIGAKLADTIIPPAYPRHDDSGKPVFTAHLRDLTTRRMAEQSLRDLRRLANHRATAIPSRAWAATNS